MSTPKAIADKTLTSILGASVAINGFFAARTFTLLDKLETRTTAAEVHVAVIERTDEYQDQRLTKNNDRLLALENWHANQVHRKGNN